MVTLLIILYDQVVTLSNRKSGIVANSKEKAKFIVNKDTAVAEGIMKAELFPCRVALMKK